MVIMEAHLTAPVSTTPRNYRRPLAYDPQSEIVRGEHFDRATGLSNTTIWRYRKAGKFVAVIQLGDNSIGARRSDIAAWLAEREGR